MLDQFVPSTRKSKSTSCFLLLNEDADFTLQQSTLPKLPIAVIKTSFFCSGSTNKLNFVSHNHENEQ